MPHVFKMVSGYPKEINQGMSENCSSCTGEG